MSDKLHYYLSDHLGSTRLVIDSAGNIMDKYTYYSFGETKSEVTSTGQSYKYTGKPLDDEGGLNLAYYIAKYYDCAFASDSTFSNNFLTIYFN